MCYLNPTIMKKFIQHLVLGTLVVFATSQANAQRLFDAVPENAAFQSKVIESVFALNPGSAVDLKLAQGFRVMGVVKSNQKVYDNLQTVVIESSNFNNAKLFISKTVDNNNQVKYVGRMLGRGYQDGIELKSDNAGNNTIKKINLKEMIVE